LFVYKLNENGMKMEKYLMFSFFIIFRYLDPIGGCLLASYIIFNWFRTGKKNNQPNMNEKTNKHE